MTSAWLRFYAELNDLLPADRRQVDFACDFSPGTTVKHLIESLGVPHTEVDLILVNGQPVDFSYQLQDGDRASVYPVFEALDISQLGDISASARLRPAPLRQPRFVLDAHLGRLAVYLRMFGFDCLYRNDYDDETLAAISSQAGRILLTRDRGLLKRRAVTHGCCVRQSAPRRQVVEVLRRFDLFSACRPFQRCLRCNQLLVEVDFEAVQDQLPPNARRYYSQFRQCPGCGQVYWQGSHHAHMQAFVDEVLAETSRNPLIPQ